MIFNLSSICISRAQRGRDSCGKVDRTKLAKVDVMSRLCEHIGIHCKADT